MPNSNLLPVARLSVEGLLFNNQVVNIHHFECRVDGNLANVTEAILNNLISAWREECESLYLAPLSQQYSLRKLTARSVVAPVLIAEYTYSNPPVGGQTIDSMANQVAAIISWRTGIAGRRYRGRTYVSGLPEQAMTGGQIEQGTLNALTLYANELAVMDDGLGGSFQLCIVSDPDSHLPQPTPPPGKRQATYDIATQYIIRPIPGTQRRRRIGVGS